MEHQMLLVFRRTGQRRYAVEARRPGFPDIEMNPAPGYDSRMPHDMMHLVVEAQLGLNRGIFGQLAAGGNAGTFHLSEQHNQSTRETKRARKRVSVRGRKLLKNGRDECLESERAAYICWQEWLARSSSRKVEQQPRSSNLNQRKLDEICKHLDELSRHWFRLDVGQSVTVSWPDLSVVNSGC
jgi:hypothetical protein